VTELVALDPLPKPKRDILPLLLPLILAVVMLP
jgi:branched-chain amino acid transport system permease protein